MMTTSDKTTGLMHRGAKGSLCVGVGTTDTPPAPPPSTTNVWARKLSGGKVAIVFLNVGKDTATVTCDAACMEKTGLAGKSVTVRDLWKKEALAPQPKLGARKKRLSFALKFSYCYTIVLPRQTRDKHSLRKSQNGKDDTLVHCRDSQRERPTGGGRPPNAAAYPSQHAQQRSSSSAVSARACSVAVLYVYV